MPPRPSSCTVSLRVGAFLLRPIRTTHRDASKPTMNSAIRTKLSVMMFLEYVIWGAWLPLLGLYLGNYLHFDGTQTAWIFNAFAIASLTGMFFGGQLADRYFAQEKFLAFSHLIGGLSMQMAEREEDRKSTRLNSSH